MKKTILLSLLAAFSQFASAQLPENFDTDCLTASFPSGGWSQYVPATISVPVAGRWACTPNKGRPTTTGTPTPGMTCTGVYSSAYNLDTSYLITPLFSLSTAAYPGGHAYLRFDTKKDDILLGGKLAVIESVDTTFHAYFDLDSSGSSNYVTPVFGNNDSSHWVTHQADLSHYIGTGSFYLAFRYTSTTTAGTAWYIDNLMLTSSSLEVEKINKSEIPISVIGTTSYSQIALSYTAAKSGKYRIMIYDLVGRMIYDGYAEVNSGTGSYVINGLDLHPGMYCIKMGNDNTYGTTKVMIQ